MAGNQHQQWIDVDSIVSAMLDENEMSPHKRFRVWQIAFRGMEMLGLDFFYKVTTHKLPVAANKTVSLPSNCLRYVKIGVLNSIGEIVTLKRNDNLTKYADLLTSRIEKVEDSSLLIDYSPCNDIYYNYWDGRGFVNLYGVPRETFIGSFTIDEDNGLVVLNPDFAYDYLLIECVSTPNPEGGKYKIPMQFKQALISFMDWKSLPAKMKGSVVWLRLKSDFYNERRNGLSRYKPFRASEVYEDNLENTRLTIKS